MQDQIKKIFIEEANELLEVLETSLMELEKDSSNDELIAKVFRALHTLKGSSGMFGFEKITSITHDIENVFDSIRNRKIIISSEIINLTLTAKDLIASILNDKPLSPQDEKIIERIKYNFANINANKGDFMALSHESESKKAEPEILEEKKKSLYLINFKPNENIFETGTNPLGLINELRDLGLCIVKAHTENIPSLDKINPEKCYTSWDIILNTDTNIDGIKDIFIFVEDNSNLNIEKIGEYGELKPEKIKELETLIYEDGIISPAKVKQITEKSEEKLELSPKDTSPAAEKTEKISKKHSESESTSSIRVSSDKLDSLVNLVSELVTTQARLYRVAEKINNPELNSVAEEVERLTWELRDNALNIRMLPIGTVFNKFQRFVRDLSQELGKEVELVTDGAETELDKNVIEKLNDPLVHIIRNCIDHGLESKMARLEKGKPALGCIKLTARHSGAHVIIEIKDDGAGLNKEAILSKAKERNLIAAESEPSEREIFNMIFLPGFSTAKEVTNISGRGVGMDVVKRTIESLRGTIEIESRINQGTSIILKLPLTLAIIDGLLVKLGTEIYVIPLSFVNECVEIINRKDQEINDRHLLNIRGELVPYISLRDHFNIIDELPSIEQIVIAKEDGMKIGFVVDNVIGENQTVIKSLGEFYKKVEGVSGATILGDGTVALIIDIPALLKKAVEYEKRLS